MHKTVHIKNIDSDALFLLNKLSLFNKSMVISKDTFILKNITLEDYALLLEIKNEIKDSQNKQIIISYE
jgi:hypothetical protein